MPEVLALALFVLCVLADHPNHPTAGDDLALHANLLYRCANLHRCRPSLIAEAFIRDQDRRRGRQKLLVAVHNPSAIQVIWTQFHCHSISGENTNKILPHPARNVSQNLMPLFELHLEHGIGQCLNDSCHYLNRVFFRQTVSRRGATARLLFGLEYCYYAVRIVTPVSVTATVCSK